MNLGRNDTASKKRESEGWKIPLCVTSSFDGQSAQADKRFGFNFQEIISLPDFAKTVPKPTQVDWYQCTKASEKTILKELGNTTGRTFGRCPP